MRLVIAALAAWLIGSVLIAVPAEAQTQRIRGTIASLDGQVLVVTTREGPQVKILLDDKYTVGALKKIDMAAIAPGTFVGIAAAPTPGGGWRALEVLLFPEAGRGSGEGHYDWDLAPGSSMTNATVTAAVNSTDGHKVNLKYKDGNVDIVIPDGTPLVTPTSADRSDVKPGAAVLVGATKAADGSLTATRLTVEKDGVKPPM
jgi:Domain of unknown function (DUF5666)